MAYSWLLEFVFVCPCSLSYTHTQTHTFIICKPNQKLHTVVLIPAHFFPNRCFFPLHFHVINFCFISYSYNLNVNAFECFLIFEGFNWHYLSVYSNSNNYYYRNDTEWGRKWKEICKLQFFFALFWARTNVITVHV